MSPKPDFFVNANDKDQMPFCRYSDTTNSTNSLAYEEFQNYLHVFGQNLTSLNKKELIRIMFQGQDLVYAGASVKSAVQKIYN